MPTPAPGSEMRPEIAPTIVTSSPSRIQTIPRPMITRQWNEDQGRRSRRAGMSVSIACSEEEEEEEAAPRDLPTAELYVPVLILAAHFPEPPIRKHGTVSRTFGGGCIGRAWRSIAQYPSRSLVE